MLESKLCTLTPSPPLVNPLRIFALSFERERSRWPYWLPVALAMGIVVYFSVPFEPSLWTLACFPMLGITAWMVRRMSWSAAIVLFVLTLVSLGFAAAQIETRLEERPMLDSDYASVPITGRVAMTEIMPDGIRLTLSHPHIGDLATNATPEKIRIKFNDLTLDDAPPTGAEVTFYGRVGAFSDPVAPGATDFRWQAYFKHLGGLGWSFAKITVTDPSPPALSLGEKFSLMFERARKTLSQHVYDHLSGDVAAMTATRLNGEQTAISPPVIEAMRIAGLAHLLSTSGFHVTIMALLIYFPIRAFLALIPFLALRYPIKKWAAVAAIFSATGYTLLVGSQAATLRSLIMTGLAMLAITLDRRTTPLRLVMMSAAIGMLIAPDAVMGPSFQMSFAAVFCLIVANQISWDWILGDMSDVVHSWLRSIAAHMGGIVRTSLIATAATTPFAIYHFQSFSLYGFIANMAAIPITSFWIMPAILLAYVTAPFGCDGIFIDAAGLGVALTIRIATTITSWPYSIFYLPAMPGCIFAAIVMGGLWLCLWREKWRYLGVLPIVIGLLYPLYISPPDFFISPEGKEWGARLEDGTLAVSNIKHDKFAVTQWQQRLGNVPAIDAQALPLDHKEIRCDDEGCIYRRKDMIVAMPTKETAALEDCAHADLVIAPFIIKDCVAKQVFDSEAQSTHGAHAIYFNGNKIRIEAARAARGLRPWSVGWGENSDVPHGAQNYH